MSNISSSYAPSKKHQIAVSILGSEFSSAIEQQIKTECKTWFGNQVDKWEVIDKHLVEKALPDQQKVHFHFDLASCKKGDNIYCAGDAMLNGSIDAALKSGRLAAEYAMQDLA